MNKAFTLIETIVVVSLTAVIFLSLTNLFLIFNSIYARQQAVLSTAGSADRSQRAFEAAILPAKNVLLSYPFGGTTYTTDSTTLVLQIPSVNSAGTIITGSSDYVAFYIVAGILYRHTLPAAGSIRPAGVLTLSTTVQSLTFTYNNVDFTKVSNVVADIQTLIQYKQEALSSRLIGQWNLRNYSPL